MEILKPPLNFRLEEINSLPQAVFDGVDPHRKFLLQHFLHHAPHFVPDVLYEISLVERHAVDSSGFETEFVDVQFFRDRVSIKPRIKKTGEEEPLGILLNIDEAKLLLLEWGARVQRWRMSTSKMGDELETCLKEIYGSDQENQL